MCRCDFSDGLIWTKSCHLFCTFSVWTDLTAFWVHGSQCVKVYLNSKAIRESKVKVFPHSLLSEAQWQPYLSLSIELKSACVLCLVFNHTTPSCKSVQHKIAVTCMILSTVKSVVKCKHIQTRSTRPICSSFSSLLVIHWKMDVYHPGSCIQWSIN